MTAWRRSMTRRHYFLVHLTPPRNWRCSCSGLTPRPIGGPGESGGGDDNGIADLDGAIEQMGHLTFADANITGSSLRFFNTAPHEGLAQNRKYALM